MQKPFNQLTGRPMKTIPYRSHSQPTGNGLSEHLFTLAICLINLDKLFTRTKWWFLQVAITHQLSKRRD